MIWPVNLDQLSSLKENEQMSRTRLRMAPCCTPHHFYSREALYIEGLLKALRMMLTDELEVKIPEHKTCRA